MSDKNKRIPSGRRYCTVPAIFGFRKWFEKRFGCDCCKQHDEHYIEIWRFWRKGEKPPITRLQADNIFFRCMIGKGKKYYPLALLSWLHLRINYWPYKLILAVTDGLLAICKEVYLIFKFMIWR